MTHPYSENNIESYDQRCNSGTHAYPTTSTLEATQRPKVDASIIVNYWYNLALKLVKNHRFSVPGKYPKTFGQTASCTCTRARTYVCIYVRGTYSYGTII